jgi:hypothetical protein
MVKAFLTVLVFGSMCSFAGLAMAQGKQGDAFGTDVSSQCAQMSDPRLKDDCVRRLRSDAQLGSERSWQGGSAGSSGQCVRHRQRGRTWDDGTRKRPSIVSGTFLCRRCGSCWDGGCHLIRNCPPFNPDWPWTLVPRVAALGELRSQG